MSLPSAEEFWGGASPKPGAAPGARPRQAPPPAEEFWGAQKPAEAEAPPPSAAGEMLDRFIAGPEPAPAPTPRRGGTRAESKPFVAGAQRAPDALSKLGLDKPSQDPGDALDRRGSPVSEEQFNALKASLAAMPREQRGAVLGRKNLPKWMLPALAEANRQIVEEDIRFQQTGQLAPIPSFEARRGKLAEGGMEPVSAAQQARSDAQLGQRTVVPGKAQAEEHLLSAEAEQQAKAEGRAWSKTGIAPRGIYDAGKGLVQAGAGLNAYVLRLAGDEEGAKRFERVATYQQAQRDAADEVDRMRRNAVDLGVIASTPAAYFERMGVQGVSSLTQMLPALASGGLTALGAGNAQKGAQIAMTLMSSQVFGQEYVNPEAMEKLSPGERAARAAGMAFLEYAGERYGAVPAVMNALMGRARKVPLEELPRWADKAIGSLQKRGLFGPGGAAVARMQAGEQIGEQVTYAGQYLLDGTPLGLDKPVSVSEYLSGAMDTAVVTLVATGLLQAGGAGALALARGRGGRPPEEPKPTADFSGGQQGAVMPQVPGTPNVIPPATPGAGAPLAPASPGAGAAAAPRPEVPETGTGGETGADAPFDAGQLLGTPIDAAAHDAATSPTNDRPEPTDPQKQAGNYKKGHIKLGGLDVSIENPQGSTRRGTDPDGKAWENVLQSHYGYIRGTEGKDGDHVDTFIKPGTPEDYSGPVFIVDQRDPRTGKFDEHKVMLGFATPEEAEAAYRANYTPDWQGLGQLSGLGMPAFKDWVRNGNHKTPFSPAFKEQRSGQQPDLAVPPAAPPGAGAPAGNQPGGGVGAVRPGAPVPGPVDQPAAAPAAGLEPDGPAADGGVADDSLSDDPDFETRWPRPRGGPTSMFNGLEDDPKLLTDAVRGVHQETRFGLQGRAVEARALLDGLANGTDPANGKPATPERLQAMRREVKAALDGINGDLDVYADEFGEDAADKFLDLAVPDYFDMRREEARLGVAPAPAPAPKKEAVKPPEPLTTESEEPWDGAQVVANISTSPMPGADPELIAALKAAGLIDAKGAATEKGWSLQRRISEISREGGPGLQKRQQDAIDQALGMRKVRRPLAAPAEPSPSPSPKPSPKPSDPEAPAPSDAERDFDDAMGELGALFGKNPPAGGGTAAAGGVSAPPAAAPPPPAPSPNVTKAGGKPNEHGHISDDTPGVEVFESPERKDGARTSFRVVEMADGSWLVGTEHNSTAGMSGGVSGLHANERPEARFTSRADAIAKAIERLRGTWERLADPEQPGSSEKQRKQARAMLAWLDEQAGVAPAPAEKKAAKPKPRPPATVNGSRMLALINRFGGINPELLSELSVRQPTGNDDKRGRPVMRWFNPRGGDGALFREGGKNVDELARMLEENGYLEFGSIERDYKEAGERARALIKSDLESPANARKAQSVDEVEAELQAERDAERDAWEAMTPEEQAEWLRQREGDPEPEFPDLSDEAAAEAEAERRAIIEADVILPADLDRADDDFIDLLDQTPNQTWAQVEAGLRAMGFSDEEISSERQAWEEAQSLKQAARRQDPADGPAGQGAPAAPGEAAAGNAPQEAQALEALADKVVNGRERAPDVARDECLLLMACSGTKADKPGGPLDLYQGPMWQTLRANVPGGGLGFELVTLSAEHGFVHTGKIMAPYERVIDEQRANELIAEIAAGRHRWPFGGFKDVQIVGGEHYRRVMRAWVAANMGENIEADASVREVSGGIGEQRKQLGEYLRGLPGADELGGLPAPPAPEPRRPDGGLSVVEIRNRIERLELRARIEAEEQLKPQVPKSFVGADHWARHSEKAKKLLDALTAERLALRKGQLAKLQRQLKAALAADPIEAQRQRDETRIDAADELIAGLNADQVVALAKALGMQTDKRRVEELRTRLLMRKADEVLAEAGRLFRGRGDETADTEAATATQGQAEPPHFAELRARSRAYWADTVIPAVRDYLHAYDAFGADRLERNNIKPAGMSPREWLEYWQRRESKWDGSRKVQTTGIQALSQKGLWPTADDTGEQLRKAMLAAIKALRGAPSTTGDMLAEAFMEKPAEPVLESYDEADLRARAEAEAARLEADRRAENERLRREAQERADRDNRARADQTVDNFQLGQSADQQMSGMDDLFTPPAADVSQVPPKRDQTAVSLRKRISILESLRDCLRR